MVDGELTMANHISHVPHPHVLLSSTSTTCGEEKLNYGTAHSLIRALVHSRLDYCNGTLAGLPQYQLNKLQSILRASARLVLLLPGRASVSSLMRVRLHWLSFPQRIKFKLCSTVYKCLHDAAPAYLSEFCVPLPLKRTILSYVLQLPKIFSCHLYIPELLQSEAGVFPKRVLLLGTVFRRTLKMELWLFLFSRNNENTFICYDMNSRTALLRRLYERRNTSTSFTSIQFNVWVMTMTWRMWKKWTLIVSLWLRIRMQIKCSQF